MELVAAQVILILQRRFPPLVVVMEGMAEAVVVVPAAPVVGVLAQILGLEVMVEMVVM